MRACRRDANEDQIVSALEKAGADVRKVDLQPFDIFVGYRLNTYLLEIKTKNGKLRDSQKEFKLRWRGHYAVVRSADEALIAIGARWT